MKTLSIDQLEEWRLKIINLQESGKYEEAQNLWNEILKFHSDQDIKKTNELESIQIFLDNKTMQLILNN
jgi:hypothetical protein